MGHVKIHFAMISYQGVHHFAYFRCIGHEPCCRCPENVVIKSHRLPPFLPPETLIGQQSILVECTPRRKPYWAATDAVGMHFCSDLSGASVPLVVAGQSSRVFGDAKTHQKRHVTWRTLYTSSFKWLCQPFRVFLVMMVMMMMIASQTQCCGSQTKASDVTLVFAEDVVTISLTN